MAWVAPRTWVAGETVTSAMLNQHIRDNLNTLSDRAIAIGLGQAGAGVLTTGVKLYLEIPAALTITGWTLVAFQSGSIVIDLWKDTYANAPPTVADTITAAAKPTLSSAQKNQDLTLTGWTTGITMGDVLGVNIDSVSTIEQVTLTLRCEPA